MCLLMLACTCSMPMPCHAHRLQPAAHDQGCSSAGCHHHGRDDFTRATPTPTPQQRHSPAQACCPQPAATSAGCQHGHGGGNCAPARATPASTPTPTAQPRTPGNDAPPPPPPPGRASAFVGLPAAGPHTACYRCGRPGHKRSWKGCPDYPHAASGVCASVPRIPVSLHLFNVNTRLAYGRCWI